MTATQAGPLPGLDTAGIAAQHRKSDEQWKDAVSQLFQFFLKQNGLDDYNALNGEEVDRRMVAHLEQRVATVFDRDGGTDDRHSPETSCSNRELLAVVWPQGPTASQGEQDPVWRALYAKCEKVITDHGQDGTRGRVRKLLAAKYPSLVLVKGKVFRGAETLDGLYLTSVTELVVREFWGKRTDSLEKVAEKIEREYDEMAGRLPEEMLVAIREKLMNAVISITTKLPVKTLTTGDFNGKPAPGLGDGK